MLQYTIKSKKNPITQAANFYPQMAPVGSVNQEQIADFISKQCTVNRADIKAVLASLEDAVIHHLQMGLSVRLGDLGSFRPTMHSFGVPTAKEVTSALIRQVRVRFTPSGFLTRKFALHNLQFMPYRIPVTKPGAGGETI